MSKPNNILRRKSSLQIKERQLAAARGDPSQGRFRYLEEHDPARDSSRRPPETAGVVVDRQALTSSISPDTERTSRAPGRPDDAGRVCRSSSAEMAVDKYRGGGAFRSGDDEAPKRTTAAAAQLTRPMLVRQNSYELDLAELKAFYHQQTATGLMAPRRPVVQLDRMAAPREYDRVREWLHRSDFSQDPDGVGVKREGEHGTTGTSARS
ncbi:unnamed protein product, partial [Lymnaea stagnalis]